VTPGKELLFVALGGSGEIGMNVNLYGCQGKWLMVDMGVTFADPAYPGVEIILPDLQFIEEQRDNLVGIVLTRGATAGKRNWCLNFRRRRSRGSQASRHDQH